MATGTIGSNEGAATGPGGEPDTRRILAGLFRRAPLIVACTLLTAGTALVFSLLQTKQYTADASLLFRDPGFDQRLFGSSAPQAPDPTREAATNITLVSLAAVADRTAASLGGGLTGDEISNKVSVQSEGRVGRCLYPGHRSQPTVRRDPGQRVRRELHRVPPGRRSQEGPAGAHPGDGRLRAALACRHSRATRDSRCRGRSVGCQRSKRSRRATPSWSSAQRSPPHPQVRRPSGTRSSRGSWACSSGSAWRFCSSVTIAGCANRRSSRRPSACRC